MREIKFKAWDKKKKEWVFGYPFHVIGETTLFDLLKQYSIENLTDLEIVQYTGQKDRTENADDRKEIYRGDILGAEGMHNMEVVWLDYGWGVKFHDRENTICEPFDDQLFQEDVSVIGNIFEHPDLKEWE